MAIEFYCPGCGNLMRTPDETAGRKGRCPTCQLKVQIPGESVANSSASLIAKPSPAKPATAKQTSIQFDCQSCGKFLTVASANAGKQGQCPHCGGRMSIPLTSSGPTASKPPSTKSADSTDSPRWKGTPATSLPTEPTRTARPDASKQPKLTTAGGAKIEFLCSNCKEVVRVGQAAAGKKGQCPRCRAVIQIPRKPTTVDGLTAIPSPAQPQPQPPASNKPAIAIPGLTPLPADPPSPRTKSQAFTSDLTPILGQLDSSLGLTPLDSDPLAPLEPPGLTPLETLGNAGLDNDLLEGMAFDDGNPFANSPNRSTAAPKHRTPKGKSGQSGPQIATMICGGCLMCYAACQLVFVILSLFIQGIGGLAAVDRIRDQGGDAATAAGVMVGQALGVGLGAVVMLTILGGGVQMIRFKSWGLCLAASILTIVPCNCFCLAGLPIGIWGTIMLLIPSVRSSFD